MMGYRVAAELLERLAIGDEGPQRERTVRRLIAHHDPEERYPEASTIGLHAVVVAVRQLALVYEACDALGIDLLPDTHA